MRDHTIDMTPEERAAGSVREPRRIQIDGRPMRLSADRLAKRRAKAKAGKSSRKANRS